MKPSSLKCRIVKKAKFLTFPKAYNIQITHDICYRLSLR